MFIESKKKAKRLNSLSRINSTSASQTNGGAKIQIKSEIAIPKLQNLAEKYKGVTNPYGFLTNLRNALGIPDSASASKYGVVNVPKEDGSTLQVSLRITNHNANADTYIRHDSNYSFNLSIVVSKRFRKNKFQPNDNVKLDEYVYYGEKLLQVENPFVQIINSIIGYLQNGQYKDTTGVAYLNQSPQQANNTENNQDINENIKMNKKQTIRLNESQFNNLVKKVVKESVKRVLKENMDSNYESDYLEAKNIINGMNFEEAKNLPHNDSRFSYGALNGNEGEGMVDLNFKSILITVRSVAEVLDNYERYDNEGQFLGVN